MSASTIDQLVNEAETLFGDTWQHMLALRGVTKTRTGSDRYKIQAKKRDGQKRDVFPDTADVLHQQPLFARPLGASRKHCTSCTWSWACGRVCLCLLWEYCVGNFNEALVYQNNRQQQTRSGRQRHSCTQATQTLQQGAGRCTYLRQLSAWVNIATPARRSFPGLF